MARHLPVPLPSPLIGAPDLAAAIGRPELVAVDCRWYLGRPGEGRRAYEAGHVPGAIHLDVDEDLADLVAPGGAGRHPLPSPAAFATRLAAAGLGDSSFVVAYDDVGGWVAARLWWMLDDLGFRGGSAVLDGGWPAWVAAGLPISSEVPAPASAPPAEPTAISLAPTWRRVIDREALKPRLGSIALLDARADERYRGEVEPIDPVAGHIPTALSAPIGGSLTADGRFLDAATLRARFAGFGCGPGADVVTSCGSGVSACHHALAMRIAGLPAPLLYPGSYSDWSSSGEPVATGPEPGAWPIVLVPRRGAHLPT